MASVRVKPKMFCLCDHNNTCSHSAMLITIATYFPVFSNCDCR